MPSLTPAQKDAYDRLLESLPAGSVFVVSGDTGSGRTTVLGALNRKLGGAYLDLESLLSALRGHHPLAIEEAFEEMTSKVLSAHTHLFLDDLHVLTNVVDSCGWSPYPRNHLLHAPLLTLATRTAAAGKKLIVGTDGTAPGPLHERAFYFPIQDFDVRDYQNLCENLLGARRSRNVEYAQIHRFAPRLNAHQLAGACAWLKHAGTVDTAAFIDYLRSQRMASNVDLGEVQPVDLRDLKGVDDVLEALEAHIILPLENDVLAAELALRPKRGVLLAGPPGTGKTTVGRALAHRLRSKFFLIDGTFISGTQNFYQKIHQVFEAAKQNAPAIIFIDDSDVIFESGSELGLYRYLLTMMDGLESESAGRICVMMTAMDVANLPPALIRSGRIELWLETRLPDAEAREAILRQRIAELPAAFHSAHGINVAELVAATDGLTGADLKRLIEDGKLLFAHDRARCVPMRRTTDYFLAAVETVRANKEAYVQAEAQARLRHPDRPSMFDMMGGMMAAVAAAAEE
jgi:transitional endoplasmic reticulum ATPase